MKLILVFFLFIQTAFAQTNVVSQFEVDLDSADSTLLLEENSARNYLLFLNKCAANAVIKFNSAHAALEGVVISSGGNYEPFAPPKGKVYGKSSSGTCKILVVEGKI